MGSVLATNGSYAPMVLNGRMRLRQARALQRVRLWYRLILVDDGIHDIQVDGATFRCGPGSMYVVQPDCSLEAKFSAGSRAAMLAFTVMACKVRKSGRRVGGRARLLAEDEPSQPTAQSVWGIDVPVQLAPALCDRLRPMVHDIAARWWLSERDHYLANRRLGRLLDEIYDAYVITAKQGEADDWQQEWLVELMLHIEEQLPSLHSIDDLLAVSGVSSTHLHRVFRQVTGETPCGFLRRRRLERAAEMLRKVDVPIRHVVQLLGFSSQSAFNNAWRKSYGMSPTAWRRLLR